jgi:hypothetical protein
MNRRIAPTLQSKSGHQPESGKLDTAQLVCLADLQLAMHELTMLLARDFYA